MSDPGLDLHEWETRWQELEALFADDAAGALPDAADFVQQLLDERGVELDEPVTVGGDGRGFVESYRSARDVADRIERGEDVDPGDVGQAIDDLRAVYETIAIERPG
jgi:hypothetical protein